MKKGFVCLTSRCISLFSSWAQEFLNEQNNGLDVLVEYLSCAQSDTSYVATEKRAVWSRRVNLTTRDSPPHFCRFDVESVENGGTLSDRPKPVDRSMEDIIKSTGGVGGGGGGHSHGVTRAARALTVR